MEPFIGQLQIFGFNFAPRGWMYCNGQLLSIAQYQALFTLIGTVYGGNGTTNFALPDLRGRAALHMGHGPGLSTYEIGQVSGSETVTLLSTQMPAHNHILLASSIATSDKPSGAVSAPAGTGDGTAVNAYGTQVNAQMAPMAITQAGGNQPHENMQPYLVLNWCIAVEGIFPSRN